MIVAVGCRAVGTVDSVPAGPSVPAGCRSKVVVHYFHRKVRCRECLAVEDLSKRIVAEEFQELVASGRLEFRSVLLDDPDNWHYVDEFLLTSPSLVIAETRDSGVVRWKKLDAVWDLIGTPSELRSYVVEAIEEYVRETGGGNQGPAYRHLAN